jgi:hypothetical protein
MASASETSVVLESNCRGKAYYDYLGQIIFYCDDKVLVLYIIMGHEFLEILSNATCVY